MRCLALIPLLTAVCAVDAQLAVRGRTVPRLELRRTIGCADCTDARQLGRPIQVELLENGMVLVVDEVEPRLRRFDAAGTVAWTGGRTGSGPGEFRYLMHVGVDRSGGLRAIDMRLRRRTELARDGSVRKTLPLDAFPAAVANRGRTGELLLVTDDFRGSLQLLRWPAGTDSLATMGLAVRRPEGATNAGAIPSVAIASDGAVALVTDGTVYRIDRVDSAGRALPPIARTVERVRRTDVEQDELDARMREGPRMAAVERARSRTPEPLVRRPPQDRTLKPHFGPDALRYDDTGRLWVLTARGDETRTVFDLFAPDGAFLGSLTTPGRITTFTVSGGQLATAGENEEGVPVIRIYQLL